VGERQENGKPSPVLRFLCEYRQLVKFTSELISGLSTLRRDLAAACDRRAGVSIVFLLDSENEDDAICTVPVLRITHAFTYILQDLVPKFSRKLIGGRFVLLASLLY
jgi:hypothetical protein